MKLKPTSGAVISTMAHKARLTSSSRTSLTSSSHVRRSSRETMTHSRSRVRRNVILADSAASRSGDADGRPAATGRATSTVTTASLLPRSIRVAGRAGTASRLVRGVHDLQQVLQRRQYLVLHAALANQRLDLVDSGL